MKRAMQLLGSSMLLAFAPVANAHEPDPAALRVASGFTTLAGSEDNAFALACALHEGTTARLFAENAAEPSGLPDFIVFDPPTGPLAWNDVKLALMLARDALRRYAITKPKLHELQAALLGGEVAPPAGGSTTLRGILRMRADGLNWGAIAAEGYRRAQ